jgi:hypothetical protein
MRRSDPRPWLHDILEAIEGVRAAVSTILRRSFGLI